MLFINPKQVLVLMAPNDKVACFGNSVYKYFLYGNGMSKIERLKRRFLQATGLHFFALNHDLSQINLGDYKIIILSQTLYPEQAIHYIRKKNQKCKLLYWLWDTVEYIGISPLYNKTKHWKSLVAMRKKYNFQITSFDVADCKKYNLIYHPQLIPVMKDYVKRVNCYNKKTVFFYGNDKGRLFYLKEIGDLLKQEKLKPKFYVVPDPYHKFENNKDFIIKAKHIPYKNIVQMMTTYPVILEVVQDGQKGLTWRPLEAMFYKRKLITNFKDIVNYDFYNPQNIFVLGVDNEEKLQNFIDTPYVDVPNTIVTRYTFDGWLQDYVKNNI